MPTWTPKAGAPLTFNLGQAFTALATGDVNWQWLLAWVSDIGAVTYDTAAFCALGPSDVAPLTLPDFLSSTDNPLALLAKIQATTSDRVFAAYCEIAGGPAGGAADFTPEVCYDLAHVGAGADFRVVDGVAIPASATVLRIRTTTAPVGGSPTAVVLNPGPLVVGLDVIGTGVGTYDLVLPGGAGAIHNYSVDIHGNGTWGVCFSTNFPAGAPAVDHTPTEQPPVVGALPPETKVYLTIPDVGAELDQQEYKLDQLRQTVAYLVQSQALPSAGAGSVVSGAPIDGGGSVDVPAGAVGLVVTCSAIPSSSSVENTSPQRYSRLGAVTFGTAQGWAPSIQIEHNPMLIIPVPTWATLVSAWAFPPATVSLTFLTR